ncbi:hypothetical protein NITLEN_20195 [Nitrospira lenta]|uniref:Uncharacterized protein n=1 Tax=Nitrospira lenta TaxID=1436998 RepID=A0A330L6I6_9BACT|nr:hypothetical protein NITLEN_20195 [Nitrospira lenta]
MFVLIGISPGHFLCFTESLFKRTAAQLIEWVGSLGGLTAYKEHEREGSDDGTDRQEPARFSLVSDDARRLYAGRGRLDFTGSLGPPASGSWKSGNCYVGEPGAERHGPGRSRHGLVHDAVLHGRPARSNPSAFLSRRRSGAVHVL